MAIGHLGARWRLMRDTNKGWIAGVCAGLADRLGVQAVWVRIAFVALGLLWHGVASVLLYVVLALLMPRGRADRMGDGYMPPGPTRPTGDVAARFAALDARLNRLEAAVTTNEFSLRQKFRDLG